MNQTIKTFFIIISIYISSIFLAFIMSPLGGLIHSYLFDVRCGSGLFLLESFDSSCAINGFVYFYILLLAFSSFLLIKKNSWLIFLIGSFVFWVSSFLFIKMDWGKGDLKENVGSLHIMLVMLVLGWLVAKGFLYFKNKVVTKNQINKS